jgi:hypothetical protein
MDMCEEILIKSVHIQTFKNGRCSLAVHRTRVAKLFFAISFAGIDGVGGELRGFESSYPFYRLSP